MKSPGIIYRKYKQLKKYFMYQELISELKKTHKNCLFGKTIFYIDKKGIKRELFICTASWINKNNQQLTDIEICNNPLECTFFSPKQSKESIKEKIEKNFSDSSYIKKNYPELYILEWILDNDLEKAKKKNNLFSIIIIKIIEFLEKILKL